MPARSADYRLDLPQLADDRSRWDMGMVDTFTAKVHSVGLTDRQAQQLLKFASGAVAPAVLAMGEAAYNTPLLEKYQHQANLLGIPPATAQKLAEWFVERAPMLRVLPPREKDPAVADAEEE